MTFLSAALTCGQWHRKAGGHAANLVTPA